jgi:hypothetical protein
METPLNYWVPIESQWRSRNIESLRPLLEIVEKTHRWVARIATHEDVVVVPCSESLGVSRLLLRRIGEELRVVEILAENGHGFQAASTACNLFEQSHYLTYIGIELENAKQFVKWNDRHYSPITIKALVNKSGNQRMWSKERCDEEYQKYRFLCGFKHNNPVYQRILMLPTDPDLYMAQYSLAESVWCILSSVALFAVTFINPHDLVLFVAGCNTLMDDVRPLFPQIAND